MSKLWVLLYLTNSPKIELYKMSLLIEYPSIHTH